MTSDRFSASDIANFLACQHLTSLDVAAAAGEVRKPYFPDPALELLRQLGLDHEKRYLNGLKADPSMSVVEIPGVMSVPGAAAMTLAALRRGADVVYQGVLQEGSWIGRPDFLRRVEGPSALGGWSYEVVETKLARSTKARALIQLCFYSDLLSRTPLRC